MKKVEKSSSETLVNFILDKSGSMESIRHATISGFNEYVNTLKKDGNKYSFSLVLFDTVLTDKYKNDPIKDVENLNIENYSPSGNTALYDAVCSTIDSVKSTVKGNQKVLTIIMTDGEENSSKEYTEKNLKDKISELEKGGKWSFVFLGANQDSWLTAQKFGIPKMNTTNFVASDEGITMAMKTMASNTSNYAMSTSLSTNAFFSASDQTSLGEDPNEKISQHFSSLGKKSWEARKRDLLK